jgi:hypothetical protein
MIPKNIHVSWKNKNLLEIKSPIIELGLKNLIRLNPDWNLTVYDDQDIDNYLKTVLCKSDYNLIADKHVVEKCDLWRLFKMYLEGGMYVDVDRICNKKLSDIIDENTKWVLPTCKKYDFSHDLMISEPFNFVYAQAIQLYLQRRREGHTSVYFLGPQTYMHSITLSLFNQIINTNPGDEVFLWMKEQIDKNPHIKLIEENPPYDTALYNGNKNDFDHEALKRMLYRDTKIKHWTGEW